jgi:hypothetical protein
MAANEIIYCLERLTDYAQFERLCDDLMSENGYPGIEPLGGFSDYGRDAVHKSSRNGRTTIFAYSVREDWLAKLREDADRIRECGHRCNSFVFMTTSTVSASERDAVIKTIRKEYRWKAELYPAERFRVMLSTNQKHLISKHPQIFTPSLFQGIADGPTITVRVSPTRHQRAQLAQFQIYNGGLVPILLTNWYAIWRINDQPHLISSIACHGAQFPIRLDGKAATTLIVDISDHPVACIETLGMQDGDGHRWEPSGEQMETFVRTALQFQPPPSKVKPPSDESLAECQVEIITEWIQQGGGAALEIVFRNTGPVEIPVRAARIGWMYEPPRITAAGESGPKVTETEGSLCMGCGSPQPVVQPGGELRLRIGREMGSMLVDVLAPDVAEQNIWIEILAGERIRWREQDQTQTAAIPRLARQIVDSWD